ncbi:MAG: ABC transporter ATP-binding protein [Acidimicrobiales bacterium]
MSTTLPPPPPTPMIDVVNVSKWFRDLVAVSEVSFRVGPGVTALLGPNGAGKSTIMRVLCGMTPPSQGTVRLLGRDPRTDRQLSREIGLVPQQESVFESLTGLEFVRLAADLHGVSDSEEASRRALHTVELDPDDPRSITTYSKGMRQRAKVAHAMVHNPRIIVLDEPLTGLDPRQRLAMVEMFHRLGDQGRCILVSSHVLEEVERFGSRVLVIAQGRLVAEGDFRAIRDLMDDRPHRIQIGTDQPARLGAALLEDTVIVGVAVGGDGLVVDTNDVAGFRRSVAVAARNTGARLREVRPLDDDLESVFRYLVGGPR